MSYGDSGPPLYPKKAWILGAKVRLSAVTETLKEAMKSNYGWIIRTHFLTFSIFVLIFCSI